MLQTWHCLLFFYFKGVYYTFYRFIFWITSQCFIFTEPFSFLQMFRKSLVKMFTDKGLDCIFLETNMSMKKQYHMVYECIPLPKEVGDMAPIYFKVFIDSLYVHNYFLPWYCFMNTVIFILMSSPVYLDLYRIKKWSKVQKILLYTFL